MRSLESPQFLKDVAAHSMTVLRDDGLYRHLKFSGAPPNSWNMWFEVVTWPGRLAIHGDMGSWCFSRVDDMFGFFRATAELKINAYYWAEKITSESRFGGPHKVFDGDYFKARVLETLDDYDLAEAQLADIVQELDSEVFADNGDSEALAHRALAEFELDGFSFSDSWEIDGKKYSYHYLWCLYAIVWAIQQYDGRPLSSPETPTGVNEGSQGGEV